MRNPNFKIVKNPNPSVGRCVNCQARYFCGPRFSCHCNLNQQYVNINEERKRKLENLKNVKNR